MTYFMSLVVVWQIPSDICQSPDRVLHIHIILLRLSVSLMPGIRHTGMSGSCQACCDVRYTSAFISATMC